MVNTDHLTQSPRHARVLLEAVRTGSRVFNVVEQHGPAAIDLKIKIALVFQRANKKLHTAVTANRGLVIGACAADIFVKHPEENKQSLVSVRQLDLDLGMVIAAALHEIIQGQDVGISPRRFAP